MRIGIVSPIDIQFFASFLSSESKRKAEKLVGQAAPSVDTLGKELLDRGHELVLFTLDRNVKNIVVLEGKNIRIYVAKYGRWGRLRASTLFCNEIRLLKKYIKKEKLDILHAHWTYEYAIAAISSKHKTCITVRDLAPVILGYYRNFYRFMRYLMAQYVFLRKKKASFISNSIYIKNELSKRYDIDSIIIPNPIEKSFIIDSEKFDKKENNRIISISTGWGERKNIEKLLLAFCIIRGKIDNAELWLVGDDFDEHNLYVRKIKESEPELFKQVKLCGRVEHNNLPDILDKCSLMIHPSLEESFGNILLEAMARKLPVIGGENSGAVPWVLNYGKAGLLCNVHSAQDIADKAVDILIDKEKWKYYSEAGHQYIIKNFTVDRIAESTLEFYKQIIKA